MSLQEIKIGNFANDGTGDDLREAFRKVNLNFQELDLRDDESTTAVNIGTIGEGVFSQKAGAELQFKRLAAGKDISLISNDDRILIDANGGVKTLLIISDSGSVILNETASLNVFGGTDIRTSITNGNRLTISYDGITDLASDPNPTLSASLTGQGYNLTDIGAINAVSISGNHIGNLFDDSQNLIVNGQTGEVVLNQTSIKSLKDVDSKSPMVGNILKWDGGKWTPSQMSTDPNEFDFGNFTLDINNIVDFLALQADVDMGTFDNPAEFSIDLGTI